MRICLIQAFWACTVILYCLAPSANAAGIQLFNHGATLSGAIWYPCKAEPKPVDLGELGVGVDYGLVGVKDCPITEPKLPLVIFSHGYKGWFGGHHDTAAALADAGFVVAALNHPGDTWRDTSRTDSLSVLVERPADIKRLIDYMLDSWPDAARIDARRIGLYGFSFGGYTGLVVIGGKPDLRKGLPTCETSSLRACRQLENGELPDQPITHDPRVKAAVIIDPF